MISVKGITQTIYLNNDLIEATTDAQSHIYVTDRCQDYLPTNVFSHGFPVLFSWLTLFGDTLSSLAKNLIASKFWYCCLG